ncbi:MAG TPA: histidine phosphatase family protein [Burkholderiales bacterium]|jgi:phosphohistidine phosphatase|nr:histidine phosphatase family protein [Burkholderiales bacterium]
MELILWRHASAAEGEPDLERKLTAKGHKQAERIAKWLLARLPSRFTVLASPARRAQETAAALGAEVQTIEALAPGAGIEEILGAAGWPEAKRPVIVVGHQPDLGRTAAYIVSGARTSWSVKKGGLWWVEARARGDERQVVVRAVLAPDLL